VDALKTPTPSNKERFGQCCSRPSSQGTSPAPLSPGNACAGRQQAGAFVPPVLLCLLPCLLSAEPLLTAAPAWLGALEQGCCVCKVSAVPSSHQRIKGSSEGLVTAPGEGPAWTSDPEGS